MILHSSFDRLGFAMPIQGIKYLIAEKLRQCALCGRFEELDEENSCEPCSILMQYEREFAEWERDYWDEAMDFAGRYYGVRRELPDYDPQLRRLRRQSVRARYRGPSQRRVQGFAEVESPPSRR